MSMRILLVEDDLRMSGFIRRGLREENYTVDVAKDGEEGLYLAQVNPYDLVILDLLLPKKGGLDVLKTLRSERISLPILILTAKDKPSDKAAGLDAGADDYLVKPFSFEEFLARIRALLRRRGDLLPTVLRAGDLEMDTLRRRVTRRDKELSLTNREYEMLEFFLRHPDEVVTRSSLAEHVWEHDFDTFSNVIDVFVARLRRKVDSDFATKLLQTVRGSGYVLKPPQPK